MRKLLTIFFSLLALNLQAQFVGFPMATNSQAHSWGITATNISPFTQIYSGIVERCDLVGVSRPQIIDTYKCYAGRGRTIFTNSYGVCLTNYYNITDNITVTNKFGAFEYNYTDYTGTHSATGNTFVTRNMIDELDDRINSLLPYFYDVSDLTDMYNVMGTNGATNASACIPQTLAKIMYDDGFGYVTNITTNIYGYVTGGNAYYTMYPATSNKILLHTVTMLASNSYQNKTNEVLPLYYFKTNDFPILKYISAGTNQLVSEDVTLYGKVRNLPDQTDVTSNETVTLTATNQSLTKYWVRVTNIVVTGTLPNTNDSISVMWTNNHIFYGTAVPYNLSLQAIDERFKVLQRLHTTKYDRSYTDYNHPSVDLLYSYRRFDGSSFTHKTNYSDLYTAITNEIYAFSYSNLVTDDANVGNYIMVASLGYQSDTDPDPWSGSVLQQRSQIIVTNLPPATNCDVWYVESMKNRGNFGDTYFDFTTSSQFPSANKLEPMEILSSAGVVIYTTADILAGDYNVLTALYETTNGFTRTQIRSRPIFFFDWAVSGGLKYQ